jgi:predicted nucleic acid-binding protein
MTAIDTNILFYAHDHSDERKMRIATSVIASLDDGVLLWQVACEYLWASRKLESQSYSYSDALEDVEDLRSGWDTVLPVWGVLSRVPELRSRGFSHWDALLIGTCLESGVQRLISEDFREAKRVDSLEIVNPFVAPGV